MDNIILNIWIEMKTGLKVRLLLKPGNDGSSFLIMEIDDNGSISKKALLVKGRKVFDNTGKCLDFGDAYPLTTEHGKMLITKQFINSWL
ncbi:MAG: hypothetical protein J6X54_01970 [Treponema sp.]|nr:hypothetical protein [Treponema sp.]